MPDPIFSMDYDDREVRRRLERLLERTDNLQPALKDIGEEILRQTDIGFETETDPYGEPWVDLSPYTISWKQQNSRILKKLQSTGRLRASITYSVEGDRVVVGTNVAYGVKHQLGLDGLEQRQFLGIGDPLKQEIIAILEDHILGDL